MHASLRASARLSGVLSAPVAPLGATAAAVIVIDAISKALALLVLPGLDTAPPRFLRLAVLHNGEAAWGLSAGAEGAALTALATLVILGLSLAVCGALAAYDRAAPVMLGLVVGAGIANATDALTSPAGVLDWIAIGADRGVVVNLADVAVVAGVGLCARTAYRLAVAIRRGGAVSDEGRKGSKW